MTYPKYIPLLRKTALFFAGFLMGTGIWSIPQALGQPTHGKEKQDALLWEITGGDLAQPSYLFGTIHALCQDRIIGWDSLVAVMGRTEQVFLEIDLDDPQTMMTMQKGLMLEGDQLLDSLMDPATYELFDTFFSEELGIPLAQLKKIKPFGLYAMLFTHPKMIGCQPQAYDMLIAQEAGKKGMEINGLESIQDQLNIFEQIPYKEQIQWLKEMIEDPENMKSEYEDLVQAYLSQDGLALYPFMKTLSPEMEAYEAEFLSGRNTRWMPTIEGAIKAKASFIAVGAGHLGGEKGVVYLLRKQGYTLRPVVL